METARRRTLALFPATPTEDRYTVWLIAVRYMPNPPVNARLEMDPQHVWNSVFSCRTPLVQSQPGLSAGCVHHPTPRC